MFGLFCFYLFLLGGSLLGWCTLGGAAVSAAPTELLALFFGWCTFSLVGALLALASGKAERRQVHPLEGSQNPLLICCPPIQAVIWLGDKLADTPLRGKSASPYSVHNVHVAPLLGDMVDIFTY